MNAISLQLSTGEYLDLYPDTTIQLKKFSPLFSYDFILGDYTFPFKLPASDRNKTLLGFPDEMQRSQILTTSIQDVRLKWKGSTISLGVLKFRNPIRKDEFFTVNFQGGLGLLADLISGKELRDLSLGGKRVVWRAHQWFELELIAVGSGAASGTVTLDIESGSYTVPVDDDFEDATEKLAALIDADRSNSQSHARAYRTFTGGTFHYFVQIAYAIPGNKIVYGYTAGNTGNVALSETDSNNPGAVFGSGIPQAFNEWQQDRVTSPDDYDFLFAPVLNPSFFADLSMSNYADYINPWDEVLNQFEFLNHNDGDIHHVATPFSRAVYLVQQLFKEHGYSVTGSWLEDAEIFNLLVYNNKSMSMLIDGKVYGAFHFNLGDYQPDVTLGEFLHGLMTLFAQAPIVSEDGKTARIVALKDVINSPEREDWTRMVDKRYELDPEIEDGLTLLFTFSDSDGAPGEMTKSLDRVRLRDAVADVASLPTSDNQINDVRFVTDIQQYYKVIVDLTGNDTWEFYSLPFQDYEFGGGASRVASDANPIMMYLEDVAATLTPNTKKLLTPYVQQIGESETEPQLGANPCGLKLMFYRGLQDNQDASINYPLASSDNIDAGGGSSGNVVGNYSLRWDGDAGLFKTWHEAWVRFLSGSEPFRFRVDLDDNSLKILWDVKKRIHHQDFLLREIDITLRMSGMISAEGVFMKL